MMTRYANIQKRLLGEYTERFENALGLMNRPDGFRHWREITQDENADLMQYASMLNELIRKAEQSETIVFPAEQAQVFQEVTSQYVETLDYRLPFQNMILQFTHIVPIADHRITDGAETTHLMAIVLNQHEIDEIHMDEDGLANFWTGSEWIRTQAHLKKGEIRNQAIAIWSDWKTSFFSWISESQHELCHTNRSSNEAKKRWIDVKRLAIACIGYINCENIYLHREDVPDSVNAKRERKGKSRLEPYYVCRIRGVQYDGTSATGTGSSHGIRYDVRGHFRRLQSGKTTWVRPHQRGLANELYVPKTYLVDKERS